MSLNQWCVIERFRVGGEQAELFVGKLQKQTGWPRSFCLGAIEEYKKFLFLACVSTTPVTPSIVVDEVWHLHLTFSRNYWQDLCRELLQRDLHHDPASNSAKALTQNQYLRTLGLYKKYFGKKAPKKYWPGVSDKPERTQSAINLFPFVSLISLMFLAFAAWASGAEEKESSGFLFWLLGCVFGFFVIRYLFVSSKKGKSKAKNKGGSCSAACGTGGSSGSNSCGPGDGGSCCGDGGSCCGGGCGGGGCGS